MRKTLSPVPPVMLGAGAVFSTYSHHTIEAAIFCAAMFIVITITDAFREFHRDA